MRAYENEPVVIMREVDAVMVPSGQPIRLKMGLAGYITQALRGCFDPEIPINIVDLGLVYECRVHVNEDQTRRIDVTMTLTAPGCGMGDVLVQDVKEKLADIPTVKEVGVELTFEPPWSHSMMSEAARLQTGMTW